MLMKRINYELNEGQIVNSSVVHLYIPLRQEQDATSVQIGVRSMVYIFVSHKQKYFGHIEGLLTGRVGLGLRSS